MTRRRQNYRLRQVCPERFPEKIDIDSLIRTNGWKVFHENFRGNYYVRGEDKLTCFQGSPKLNGLPITQEEKSRLLLGE